jgi:zinc D-Ala-D-Ala dipeptidase
MKALLFFVFLALIQPATAQIKAPSPAPVKPNYADSLQAVVVTTKNWENTQGSARLYERRSLKDDWKAVGKDFPVTVGRSGLGIDDTSKWSEEVAHSVKREGDGRSPAGLFPLTSAFGKPESVKTKLSYQSLSEQTECVDDVNSHHYNKIVNRLQVGIFDWKSSEKMASITPEYDLGVFVAYNTYPVVKGRGSCIFLHVWESPNDATSGCTAMSKEDLERVVAWLDPKKTPYLIQMPEQAYSHYKKSWNLPNLK